jgi:hypothetical protein
LRTLSLGAFLLMLGCSNLMIDSFERLRETGSRVPKYGSYR